MSFMSKPIRKKILVDKLAKLLADHPADFAGRQIGGAGVRADKLKPVCQ